jgi:glycosyltransferase involved in cell wall biosynthesis
VSPESGFKIRAVTPDDAVERFAEAMNRLSDSPELRSQMGEAARARATNEFHWRQKGEQFSLWYGQVTATLGPSLLRGTT